MTSGNAGFIQKGAFATHPGSPHSLRSDVSSRSDTRGVSEVPRILLSPPMEHIATFFVGQVVHHQRFDYRGVVYDVDATFQGTDEWYETVARSRPPKDRPWYHVLPDGAPHQTYVADRNLQPDHTGRPIEHPLVERFFTHFIGGRYVSGRMN